jgi:chemotaxis protein methyltransferase CheR
MSAGAGVIGGGSEGMFSDPALSDGEFELLQRLIYAEAGIYLAPTKKGLMSSRLARRVRELGLPSFRAYYERVSSAESPERTALFNAICTNETRFFREPEHFELLQSRIIPAWIDEQQKGRRSSRVRVWSAACSTGEEPLTLAMVLTDALPDWTVELDATDLSTKALDKARANLYSIERARDIPEAFLKRYMLRGKNQFAGSMKARPELHARIRYQRANLNQPPYPVSGPFDVIFCRNVFIYFDRATRERALTTLAGMLAPGGFLFLGHAESLAGLRCPLRPVAPTVYTLSEGPRR